MKLKATNIIAVIKSIEFRIVHRGFDLEQVIPARSMERSVEVCLHGKESARSAEASKCWKRIRADWLKGGDRDSYRC